MQETMDSALQLFAGEEPLETGDMAADAGQEENSQASGQSSRPSWQDIMADPEYKREFDNQVQSIVKKRLRGRYEAETRLEKLAPVLEALGRRYAAGGDIGAMDAGELAQSVLNGETRAEATERAGAIRAHLNGLMEQEKELRARFPDFSLAQAMEDPRFIRLTAPNTHLTLEEAYCALHYRELGQEAALRGARAAADTVRAGRARPKENPGGQAASTTENDPKKMTKQQREELKKRIYDAKAQGKKLPYGG